jgi:hypothetical protein
MLHTVYVRWNFDPIKQDWCCPVLEGMARDLGSAFEERVGAGSDLGRQQQ